MTTETTSDTKGILVFLAIALAVVVALAAGFTLGGLAGLTMVMVVATPVILAVLVLISVGR